MLSALGNAHNGGDTGHTATDGFQIMGLVNAFKTGDVQTDMLIALIVPILLKFLFDRLGKLEGLAGQHFTKFFNEYAVGKRRSKLHERFISHATTKNMYGYTSSVDQSCNNAVLLKAIKLYLHHVVKLKLQTAYVDLAEVEEKQSGNRHYDDDDSYDDDWDCINNNDDDVGNDEDDDDYEDDTYNNSTTLANKRSGKTMAGSLGRYKIIQRLPNDEWQDLGTYGKGPTPGLVRLCVEQSIDEDRNCNSNGRNNDSSKSNQTSNTVFHFTSTEAGAIDDFIDTAYKWYLKELDRMEDHSRYLYQMKIPETRIGSTSDDSDGNNNIRYKRYKLSDRKKFNSLFFREKENLLSLVDHFRKKTGKYSIPGFPHKLGILLHGPPGTGKTSLIKALAQYTGRSIVNVPLSCVETNSDLESVFFDRKFKIDGSYVPVKLSFKDIIFVCEDVDAASKVVKRRDGKTKADLVNEESMFDLPEPKCLFRLFLESSKEDCKAAVDILVEKSDRLKEEADKQRPLLLKSMAKSLTRIPALGMIDESANNSDLAKYCSEAMDGARSQNERKSKLDDILSIHAQSMKQTIESGAEVDDEFVDELLGKIDQLSCPPTPPASPHQRAGQSSSFLDDGVVNERSSAQEEGVIVIDSSIDTYQDEGSERESKSSKIGPYRYKDISPDALSLAGLLNVLDGVVDTPGRILIMTTNHPERLDPALVRPGRIDKTIFLGFISSTDAISLLELYFQTKLDDDQKARVHAVIATDEDGKEGVKATPAQIEQLAAEHDRLDDMLDALEQMHPANRRYRKKKVIGV